MRNNSWGEERSVRKRSRTSNSSLDDLVLADQLVAIRRSTLIAMPVNTLLGLACLLVASHNHEAKIAGAWFIASALVNCGRVVLCRQNVDAQGAASRQADQSGRSASRVGRQLHRLTLAALLSGFVWAGVPLMCGGYTSPATLFYLTVVCGVTAGAVTHGTAYARVPLSFVTPPLLAVIACLFYEGTFERYCLAATVALYLAALWHSAIRSEAAFRQSSLIKNEATSLSKSLKIAHRQALDAEKSMRHLAWHDHLTGLLNRAGFMAQAQQNVSASPAPACLMMLDLDGFKVVNDIYGHGYGDEVLSEVANHLRSHKPPDALVARLGGDEFAILYTPNAGDDSPEILASRLISAMPSSITKEGRLGMSIGIYMTAKADLADILTCADEALYAAKNAGRNQIRVFDVPLRDRLEVRRTIERDFSQAIADRSLSVFFQPILRTGEGRVESVEALLRWKHPKHGWIAPPDIVFIADTSGQSQALLEYVLDRTCEMMLRLRQEGFGGVRVAVNLSPRKIAQIQVDSITLEKLASMGLPSSMLEIEVTEETTTDIDIVQWRLGRLSAAGVRIVVDDFGVGYSSLSSLIHPYVSKVKIDRSLLSDLTDHQRNQMLIEAILQLGQLLKIEVVAEGVENESEFGMLRSLGCELMQGFYLAMPMPADEFMQLMKSRVQARH